MALSGFPSQMMQNASFMGGQLGAPQMAQTMSMGMPQQSMYGQQQVQQQQQQSPANMIQTMVVLLQAVIGLLTKLIASAQGQQQGQQQGQPYGQPSQSYGGGSPMGAGGGYPQAMASPQQGAMQQFAPAAASPYAAQPQYGGGMQSGDPYGAQPSYGGSQPMYGAQPQYGAAPSYGQTPSYGGGMPAYGQSQPSYGVMQQPSYGQNPGYGSIPPEAPYGAAPTYGAQPQYGGGHSDPYAGSCSPCNSYPSPQTYPGWYYDVPSQQPPYDPNSGVYGPGQVYPGGENPYGPYPGIDPMIGYPLPIDGIGGEPYPETEVDPFDGEDSYPTEEPSSVIETVDGLTITNVDDDTTEDDPFGDTDNSDDPFGDSETSDDFDTDLNEDFETDVDTDTEEDDTDGDNEDFEFP